MVPTSWPCPLHASLCSSSTHPCPGLPPPARRGDGASQLGCRTDSLWAREHSMARALTRPQLQVRTQNDPDRKTVMQPPLYPTRQPVHKRWLRVGVAVGDFSRGCGPKAHRTLEPEGNLETPLLNAPLDSWENWAQTGEGLVRSTE